MVEFRIGENFKAHEMMHRAKIRGQVYVGLRFDGKSFHRFTRGFEKPFDLKIRDAMVAATRYLVQHTQGALLGYTQSDEISLIVSNMRSPDAQLPFNGEVEKLLSILASQVSVAFYHSLLQSGYSAPALPAFDGRIAFTTKNVALIEEYLLWRRTDSRVNAVQAACQARCSQTRLHGVSSDEQAELLVGTPFEHIQEDMFWGTLVVKTQESVTGVDPRSGEVAAAIRTRIVDEPATRAAVSDALKPLPRSH